MFHVLAAVADYDREMIVEGTLDGLSFDEKLDRIVAWIAKAGTLTEAQENADGTITVKIHNCPFRNTALKFPQVCTITPHLLAGLLEAPVSQENSIHRRDPFCSFIVQRPRPAGAD